MASSSRSRYIQSIMKTFTADTLAYKFYYRHAENQSLIGILCLIVEDILSHRHLHDWDDELVLDPVKAIASFAHSVLESCGLGDAGFLVNFSVAREIRTVGGITQRLAVLRDPSGAGRQLFPALDREGESPSKILTENLAAIKAEGPNLSFGRITEIREHGEAFHRSAMLLLHTFSLLLEEEDPSFVWSFVRRHLLMKSLYHEPHQFQDIEPSDRTSRYYKRVTLSFHLPHFLLERSSEASKAPGVVDREIVGSFGRAGREGTLPTLCKAASSVLLTIVLPHDQPSREEELSLLSNPEAFWGIVIVNGSWATAMGASREPVEYLTPLAQFVRGISSAAASQRINITAIVRELKERLLATENNSLFDDKLFTKSRTYHWIISACHDLSSSLQASVKFLREVEAERLPMLRAKAHAYEQLGIDYWRSQLREECSELDKSQLEISVFREQVREMRDALHGATSLLESRIAVMQGDRIKTLTYLSIAYLPLSTVSGFYSMTVLPQSANFTSYFIVLAVFLIATMALASYLQTASSYREEISFSEKPKNGLSAAAIKTHTKDAVKSVGESTKNWITALTSALTSFFTSTVKASRRCSGGEWLMPLYLPFLLLLKAIGSVLLFMGKMAYLLVWDDFSIEQLIYCLKLLQRPQTSVIHQPRFSFAKFCTDVIRFFAFPIWLCLLCLKLIAKTVVRVLGYCLCC